MGAIQPNPPRKPRNITMDCDIHLFKEKLVNHQWVTNNTWEKNPYKDERNYRPMACIDNDSVWRNYALFGYIANVRWDCPQGYTPRNLPHDVSPEVQTEANIIGVAGHSHSWLTLEELNQHPAAIRIITGEAGKQVIQGIENILEHFTEDEIKNPKNHRIVFWFDN